VRAERQLGIEYDAKVADGRGWLDIRCKSPCRCIADVDAGVLRNA